MGPIARSAEDLELLLGILAREEPWSVDLAPAPDGVRSLRVAAWLDDPFCPVDSEVLDVIRAATSALEASGVSVDREARPDIDAAEASEVGNALVFAAVSQSGIDLDAGISHLEWLNLHMRREAIRAKWAEFFEGFDAVLMPVAFVPPLPPPARGHVRGRASSPATEQSAPTSTSSAGQFSPAWPTSPRRCLPIGLGASGLPIGIQVVGPYGADYRTIRLAGHIAGAVRAGTRCRQSRSKRPTRFVVEVS